MWDRVGCSRCFEFPVYRFTSQQAFCQRWRINLLTKITSIRTELDLEATNKRKGFVSLTLIKAPATLPWIFLRVLSAQSSVLNSLSGEYLRKAFIQSSHMKNRIENLSKLENLTLHFTNDRTQNINKSKRPFLHICTCVPLQKIQTIIALPEICITSAALWRHYLFSTIQTYFFNIYLQNIFGNLWFNIFIALGQ